MYWKIKRPDINKEELPRHHERFRNMTRFGSADDWTDGDTFKPCQKCLLDSGCYAITQRIQYQNRLSSPAITNPSSVLENQPRVEWNLGLQNVCILASGVLPDPFASLVKTFGTLRLSNYYRYFLFLQIIKINRSKSLWRLNISLDKVNFEGIGIAAEEITDIISR